MLSFHFLLLFLLLGALVWASSSVLTPLFMGCIYKHTTPVLRTAVYMCVSPNIYLSLTWSYSVCVIERWFGHGECDFVLCKRSALTEGQGHELVVSGVKGRMSGVLIWSGCGLLPSAAMASFFSAVKSWAWGGLFVSKGLFSPVILAAFLKTSQLGLLHRDCGTTSVFNLKGEDFQALTVMEEWF